MTDGRPSLVEQGWPDPETGPYALRIWNGFVDGRPAVVGIELRGPTP